jgi:hypothetical protein
MMVVRAANLTQDPPVPVGFQCHLPPKGAFLMKVSLGIFPL